MLREQNEARSAPWPRWLQLGLVLGPVVVAYALLARYVTRVPLIDDYWHIFAFAIQYTEAPTLAAKAGLLLTVQGGPYKLIFDHALIALDLLLFGRLTFPLLILLGNLTPLGILALLWRNTPRRLGPAGYRYLLLLPVTLLLFNLNYAETLDWAISGLQQPAVVLFSLAAIHFLVKSPSQIPDLLLACFFALLACATYANGVLLWPLGLGYLLLRDRRLSRLLGWCATGALALVVYLYHYSTAGLTAPASLARKALFFIMFAGGGLENMHHQPVPYVSVAVGVAVLVVLALSLRSRYDLRNPFFFCTAIWILLTAAVVTEARIGMGLQLSLSSRYKIYCDLLLIVCYEFLLDRVSLHRHAGARRRFFVLATGAALVMNAGGDIAGAKFLATRRARAEAAMRSYLRDPASGSPMFLVDDQSLNPEEVRNEDQARQQMNEARRLHIYEPPTF